MVLAWSMDRVGPMCRTVEDCAMVFNVLHGVDEKDPSTVMTPFNFQRNVDLGKLRIGVDPSAPAEFVAKLRDLGMRPRSVGARPTVAGVGNAIGVEGAAAFDAFVQQKAKEMNIDLDAVLAAADSAASARAGGAGAGGGGGGGAGGGGGGSGAPADPLRNSNWNPRFVSGRAPRAYDYIQTQRRRHIMVTQWGEYMKDLDMFIGSPTADIGANAQTGHPCVVVPYKFDVPVIQQGPGGGAGAAPATPPPQLNPQPICAVIVGALYNDDGILSVAHRFQTATDFHTKRPSL
jgi:Asp-tRNA(Asn)/Glu-tRNA(Gln) amidotransferase A subunit family amidase